jgi:diguanylate cyclase (GGDEF)-like protein
MTEPLPIDEFEFRPQITVAYRLAFRTAVLGFILLFSTFSILIPWQIQTLKERAVRQAQSLANVIASLYQAVERNEDVDEVSRLILKVAHMPSVAFISLIDQNGKVIHSTDFHQINHVYSKESRKSEGNNFLYVTQAIPDPKLDVSTVLVVIDLSSVYADHQRFYLELGIGFILAIILLSLIMAWITRSIVGYRLARLAKAMGNAEKGSFLVRAQVDKLDEVGAVTLAFNKLLAAITNLQVKEIEREQDLKSAHEQLSIKAQLEKAADELHASNESLKRRVKAQELLMDAAHHLGGVLNKDALVSRLVVLIRDKLGWPDFAIFLKEPNEDQLRLVIASGLPNIDIIKELSFDFGEGITGLVAEKATPIAIGDLAKEPRMKLWSKLENLEQLPDFLKHGSMLSVPMSYQGHVVGVMDFFYPKLNAFDDEDVTLLHALGALLATSIVNADLYEATLELATSDSLTGVLNRRAMERVIENEVARAQRFSTPLSLLLVDVDHFKNYNDQMGHLMGDVALKEIASCLQRSVRKVDSVARFGGEEFCVILPQTGEQSAMDVAEKLCAAIRKLDLPGAYMQPLKKISVSIGIAVYPDHMPPILEQTPTIELIHVADEALYAAKRKGRDRVVRFEDINTRPAS